MVREQKQASVQQDNIVQQNEQDTQLARNNSQGKVEEETLALDSVLDDIESVLETNAQEYVNSFVQKGGE
ncbi:MAG: ubiquitin-like protein Pup [Bifidobacteriaceae bacterium]|nr:ubiquitin-like protein Pup [Bifidobacteriaceae bacterium]